MYQHQKSNLILYAVGRLVSLIGSAVQMIAIPLFILDLTGSGAMMGIFSLVSILPRLLIMPFAGVLGDRLNRKWMMVNMDFARGVLIFVLAYIAYNTSLTLVILFIAQATISILDAFFSASTSAMLPELVPPEDLRKANSFVGGVTSSAMIIGPVLGGVLYGFIGIEGVFAINAVSFVLSAVSEIFIIYPKKKKGTNKMDLKTFFLDLKEGISFVNVNYALKYLFFFAMSINFLFSPLFSVVFPFLFRKTIGFGDTQYGLIQTFFTIGMLVGNILLATILSKKSSKKLMVGGLFWQMGFSILMSIIVFPFFLAPLMQNLWIIFGIIGSIMIIVGATNTFLNIPISTNLQIMVPNRLRSRVFTVLEVLGQIMTPLGALIYGFLLDIVPVHWLFFTVNIVGLALCFGFVYKAPEGIYTPVEVKG